MWSHCCISVSSSVVSGNFVSVCPNASRVVDCSMWASRSAQMMQPHVVMSTVSASASSYFSAFFPLMMSSVMISVPRWLPYCTRRLKGALSAFSHGIFCCSIVSTRVEAHVELGCARRVHSARLIHVRDFLHFLVPQ